MRERKLLEVKRNGQLPQMIINMRMISMRQTPKHELILLAACTRCNQNKNKVFKNQQFYEFISHEEHENVQENGLRNSFFVCKHLKKDFFQ